MSKREILAGATSQTIDILIKDSSSTIGAGLTGLAYNTASLTCYYRKGATGTATALSLATQTVGGAFSSGGFVAVDGTNMPGVYRLDLANAMVDTAGMLTIMLKGATNMVPCVAEIEVVSVNKFDAMRMGMTALPNALPDNAGGLPLSDAGGLDMDGMRADVAAILVDTGTTLDGRIPAALGANGNMKADVRDYSGTAGTFSAGRPEVNASHWGGTAVASALVRGNVIQWTGTNVETPDVAGVPNVSLNYVEGSSTTSNNIGNVFGTDFATNYDDTNNRWLVDVRRLGGTAVSANSAANWHTLYENDAQVSAVELSDVASATKMKIYFGLALRKDAAIASDRATELAEINFNWGAGAGAYVSTTDANEALRDRGDAAWITATGFSTLDVAGVRTAVGLASANLDTQIGTLATAANLSTVAGYLDTEIAAILADTNELQTDWTNGGRLDLLLDGCATPSQVNTEVLDVINVDTLIDGKTIKEAVRAIAATTTAKVSGAGTGTEVFVGMDGTTVRVTATVDASGNRTAVVYG